MEAKLSQNVKKAIANSRDEALRLKNGAIGDYVLKVQHFLKKQYYHNMQKMKKQEYSLKNMKV